MNGFPPDEFGSTLQCLRFRHTQDTNYLLAASYRVLGMQAGFGLIESAFTRKINCANIMAKNVVDFVISSLLYVTVGYGIAFGTNSDPEVNKYIGSVSNADNDAAMLLFQYSFAATTSTIDSGALAERTNLWAYLLVSSLCCSIFYPVVTHWGWTGDGFLSQLGFLDFAGGMIVHGFGGFFALTSAICVGPRIGRFASYSDRKGAFTKTLSRLCCLQRRKKTALYYRRPVSTLEEENFVEVVDQSNPVQMLFGTLVLWMGWYGFNGGSTFGLSDDLDLQASKVAIVTTIGAATGGFGGICYTVTEGVLQWRRVKLEVPDLCTGILAGLVGITAGANWFTYRDGAFIGFSSGVLACWMGRALAFMHIDDVVSAFPVHGFCGMYGTICIGVFAYPNECSSPVKPGLLYGGDLEFVGVQIFGCLAIMVFAIVTALVTCNTIEFIPGLEMRCRRADEILGLDFCEHWINPGNNLDFQLLDTLHEEATRGAASLLLFEQAELDQKDIHTPGESEGSESAKPTREDVMTEVLNEAMIRVHDDFESKTSSHQKRIKRMESGYERRLENLENQRRLDAKRIEDLLSLVRMQDQEVARLRHLVSGPVRPTWCSPPDSAMSPNMSLKLSPRGAEQYPFAGREEETKAARRIQKRWRKFALRSRNDGSFTLFEGMDLSDVIEERMHEHFENGNKHGHRNGSASSKKGDPLADSSAGSPTQKEQRNMAQRNDMQRRGSVQLASLV